MRLILKERNMKVQISKLDSERFGINVAKAVDFSQSDLDEINTFCNTENIDLIIARVSTNDIAIAQKLEDDDYRLMDTLVYYKFDYAKKPAPPNIDSYYVENVSGNVNAASEISDIARQAFHGYFGHYHADPRLDKAICDDIYVDWAYRSCVDPEVSSAVLAAFVDEEIAGFITLKTRSAGLGEIVLNGVSPKHQKRRVYQSLVFSGMDWLHDRSMNQVIVSTQLNNISVQKVWARLGFEMDHSYYTFHKWFQRK